MFMPAGGKPRQRFDRFWKHTFLIRHMHIWRYVTGLAGGGDVDVHVNLRHVHIVRYVTGLGGGGDVNVHVSLRHMRIWRYVTGFGGGVV